MGCDGCVKAVAHALQQIPDVEKAEVTLDPPAAVVTTKNPVAIEKLREAVKEAGGYDIREPSNSR